MKKKAIASALSAALIVVALGGCAAAPSNDQTAENTAPSDMAVEQTAQADSTVSLTKEEAITYALTDAGFQEDQATNITAHKEMEDGIEVYEVTYYVDGVEYDYVLSADDGTIISAEQELAND